MAIERPEVLMEDLQIKSTVLVTVATLPAAALKDALGTDNKS